MVAIFTLLLIMTFSILLTRIATYVLIHTGLSREMARFQARSALSGVGYTTGEAEYLVNHPVRRKVVMLLMLLGNAGLVTVLASLILTFVDVHTDTSLGERLLILVGGLSLLWAAASSTFLDRWLAALVRKAMQKYSWLDVTDYASLLHLSSGFRVADMAVNQGDWVCNATLKELQLDKEGTLILGITRADGMYIAAPSGTSRIFPGDTLLLYGQESMLERLDVRKKGPAGDQDHAEAMHEHDLFERDQQQNDPGEQRE